MTRRIIVGDERRRREHYLNEVVDLLFPPREGDGDVHRFIAVPNLRDARVLVPEASRTIAAAALRQYARPAARGARLRRDVAVAAVVTGLDRLLLPHRIAPAASDGDFAAYLSRVLGERVHLCVLIGPARANRKPVVQVLADDGRAIGFAKIGVSTLTRSLVRAESHALTTLAGHDLSRVEVPRPIHSGQWAGREVLVQEALPGWTRPGPFDEHRLHAAMREFAHCTGTETTAIGDGRFSRRLRRRLESLDDSTDGKDLVRGATALLDRHDRRYLTFGASHGDWAPWNMAMLPSRLLVWDLERFTTDVPVGFDPLHHAFQNDIVARRTAPEAAVEGLVADAPRLLVSFGVDRARSRLTALLYLVDLATRYLGDRQAEHGAALGALGQWLLPTLLRQIDAEAVAAG